MSACRGLYARTGVGPAMVWDAVTHTFKLARSRWCTYGIGCCSITLVVCVCACVNTLIAAAPLIFLREAESANGQIDLRLRADSVSRAPFLNYTRVSAALPVDRDVYAQFAFHAPRMSLSGSTAWALSRQGSPGDCSLPLGFASSPVSVLTSTNAWMYAPPGTPAQAVGLVGGSSAYAASSVPLPLEMALRPPSDPGFIPADCGASSCTSSLCVGVDVGVDATLLAVDLAREAAMGVGRAWDYGLEIPPGNVLLHASLASSLRVRVGDVVMFRLRSDALTRYALAPVNATLAGWGDSALVFSEIAVPMRVWKVVPTLRGKLGVNDVNIALTEFKYLAAYLAPRLHPRLTTKLFPSSPGVASVIPVPLADALGGAAAAVLADPALSPLSTRMYQYAGEILFNLPPSTRIESYTSSNYDRVRAAVADFASNMLYVVGFTESSAELGLLTSLEARRFITLYLGLVLDVLLIILFALSVILIYSLLLVNAEERTFEMAVRRMVGTQRSGVIMLLIVQALGYGIPAWVAGLVGAQIITAGVLRSFSELSSIPISILLTPRAILTSTALALAIPAVSAIGPIRAALKRNIRDALDSDRPKASAVQIKIERSSAGRINRAVVIVGFFMAVFGFGIYYLLPLALLSLNLSLFFNLFLAIIVGMLAGLILLSLNVELLLLRAAAAVTAQWWESSAVFSLLWSNISAGHRKRNRKTTLMYALSIAFIVFVAVAAETQVQSATFAAQAAQGSPLNVGFETPQQPPDPAMLAAVEAVVRRTKWITGAAWVTARGDTSLGFVTSAAANFPTATAASMSAPRSLRITEYVLRSKGRLGKLPVGQRGIGPRYLGGATYSRFITPESADPPTQSSLSLSEQLYTPRGSGGVIASNSMYWELWLTRGQDAIIQTIASFGAANTLGTSTFGATQYSRTRQVVTALLSNSPGFFFARGPSALANTVFTSLPQHRRLVDAHSTTTGVQRVAVQRTVVRTWTSQLLQALRDAVQTVPAANAAAAATLTYLLRLPLVAYINSTAFASDLRLNASIAGTPAWSLALAQGCVADVNVQRACALVALLSDAAQYSRASADILGAASGVVSALGLGTSSDISGEEFPAALRAAATAVSVDDLPLGYLYLNFDEGAVSSADRNAFKTAVTDAVKRVRDARTTDAVAARGVLASRSPASEWSQRDMAGLNDDLAVTVTLLQLFFAVLALVAMILCFFSLLASMVTNINEQKKEIAILRALGLPATALIRIYVHEAVLLVLTASLTGTIIGCVVAWTFGAQQSLFTALPLPFAVPWGIITVVCFVSLVASVFAAGLPARSLTRRTITALLRGH